VNSQVDLIRKNLPFSTRLLPEARSICKPDQGILTIRINGTERFQATVAQTASKIAARMPPTRTNPIIKQPAGNDGADSQYEACAGRDR
jgi:hypothetical protein